MSARLALAILLIGMALLGVFVAERHPAVLADLRYQALSAAVALGGAVGLTAAADWASDGQADARTEAQRQADALLAPSYYGAILESQRLKDSVERIAEERRRIESGALPITAQITTGSIQRFEHTVTTLADTDRTTVWVALESEGASVAEASATLAERRRRAMSALKDAGHATAEFVESEFTVEPAERRSREDAGAASAGYAGRLSGTIAFEAPVDTVEVLTLPSLAEIGDIRGTSQGTLVVTFAAEGPSVAGVARDLRLRAQRSAAMRAFAEAGLPAAEFVGETIAITPEGRQPVGGAPEPEAERPVVAKLSGAITIEAAVDPLSLFALPDVAALGEIRGTRYWYSDPEAVLAPLKEAAREGAIAAARQEFGEGVPWQVREVRYTVSPEDLSEPFGGRRQRVVVTADLSARTSETTVTELGGPREATPERQPGIRQGTAPSLD